MAKWTAEDVVEFVGEDVRKAFEVLGSKVSGELIPKLIEIAGIIYDVGGRQILSYDGSDCIEVDKGLGLIKGCEGGWAILEYKNSELKEAIYFGEMSMVVFYVKE